MQKLTLGILASGPRSTPTWQSVHCMPFARCTLCVNAIGWTGVERQLKNSRTASKTVPCAGVKTSELGVGEGLPLCASARGLDLKRAHPRTVTQATMAIQNHRLEERPNNERLPSSMRSLQTRHSTCLFRACKPGFQACEGRHNSGLARHDDICDNYQPDFIPYGTALTSASMRMILPSLILKSSAICHVQGAVRVCWTVRPSVSL